MPILVFDIIVSLRNGLFVAIVHAVIVVDKLAYSDDNYIKIK